MSGLADFIIIGAMKCATSTLHEQLARQPGVFMTDPKEPCFFSDDEQWKRGQDWYRGLFRAAHPGDLCGESSTHYTKLPTYPHTVERMFEALGPNVRLIYVMRDPLERLVSQYIHEWSQGVIPDGVAIDEAVVEFPELVQYGRYAYQLEPYRETFGERCIMPVFFERLIAEPQRTLEQIAGFLRLPSKPVWMNDLAQQNDSAQRVRRNPVRDSVLAMPGVRSFVRKVVPQQTRHRLMRRWSMQKRPELGPTTLARVQAIYDADLALMGHWLGLQLNSVNFRSVAQDTDAAWASRLAGAQS